MCIQAKNNNYTNEHHKICQGDLVSLTHCFVQFDGLKFMFLEMKIYNSSRSNKVPSNNKGIFYKHLFSNPWSAERILTFDQI